MSNDALGFGTGVFFPAKYANPDSRLFVPGTKILPVAPPSPPKKNLDFRNQARLAIIPRKTYSLSGAQGSTAIYLPHLPEELELARENSYDSSNNLATPDGVWIYKQTSPMELNLAFTLHAFDEFCPEGPKTLLDIAARLHAMVLPASNDTIFLNWGKSPAPGSSTSSQSQQAAEQGKSQAEIIGARAIAGQENLKFPVACSLRLVQAGPKGLGVNCSGFVKSVSVMLRGPWLQAVDNGSTYNLPSSATYKFTFMHNPAYTNLYTGDWKTVQAFAPDVLEYFYNTAHLTALSNSTYADIDALDPRRQLGSGAFESTVLGVGSGG